MNIVLVRHGRPEKSENARLNSAGFANWVKNYNHSLVATDSRPINTNAASYEDFYVISSDLPRAVHSTKIFLDKSPHIKSSLFREMDIPRFKIPFVLNAWTWVYLNRMLWMLGKKGSFESYKEARLRASNAAAELIALAKKHNNVIVFAHGYLNLHMRKHLRQYGLKQVCQSNDYWGISRFEMI
jgi:broad specificity phosphatase PhoE